MTPASPFAGAASNYDLLGQSSAPRPMLARVADNVYWMSRYVERAEHIARMLSVSSSLLTDVGDLAPDVRDEMWLGVMKAVRMFEQPPGEGPIGPRVIQYMGFDPLNPNSLLSCVSRARENARAVREVISREMWEQLNTLYWGVRVQEAAGEPEATSDELLTRIINGSMLFQGLADETLPHEQAWLFIELAKHLERADITARLLETRIEVLTRVAPKLETPLRNIHWMAVLRMCGALEAYRRHNSGDFDPLRVAAFVTFDRAHPRSVRHCAGRAMESISAIHRLTGPSVPDSAERVLGRLVARLDYAEPAEIHTDGFASYLRKVQDSLGEANAAIQQNYFLL